jgi:hypothetical protein
MMTAIQEDEKAGACYDKNENLVMSLFTERSVKRLTQIRKTPTYPAEVDDIGTLTAFSKGGSR